MLVAHTKNILIHAVSLSGEIISAWEEDGIFRLYHYYPDSELDVTISKHVTAEALVAAITLHAWVLQGIKDKRIETEIYRYI